MRLYLEVTRPFSVQHVELNSSEHCFVELERLREPQLIDAGWFQSGRETWKRWPCFRGLLALSLFVLIGTAPAIAKGAPQLPPSVVDVAFLGCEGTPLPVLVWSGPDQKEHSIEMRPGSIGGVLDATLFLAEEGTYRLRVSGNGPFCSSSADVLVLAGLRRSITLVPNITSSGLASLTGPYGRIQQLGGTLPISINSLSALCTGDDGTNATYTASLWGSAYYFDYIDAWVCKLQLQIWGRRYPVVLTSPVDIRPLSEHGGFVRRDITLRDIERAANLQKLIQKPSIVRTP